VTLARWHRDRAETARAEESYAEAAKLLRAVGPAKNHRQRRTSTVQQDHLRVLRVGLPVGVGRGNRAPHPNGERQAEPISQRKR